jgi:hypothetical protein
MRSQVLKDHARTKRFLKQVVSPFQAILDYEIAHGVPPGYVNATIQAHSPNGSWQRLERGEMTPDDSFFALFHSELANIQHWRNYCLKLRTDPTRRAAIDELARQSGGDSDGVPPMPKINAQEMFWNMMRMSRSPDPYMFPALIKLRASGRFVIAALSNTIAFPSEVKDDKGQSFRSGLRGRPVDVGSPETNGGVGEEMGEIRDRFDVFISSAHVGLRKPDRRIYELAVEEIRKVAKDTSIQPKDIVFIDDIGGNLKAAKQLGFGTIKVNLGRSKEAVKELEAVVGMSLIDEASRL